MGKRIIGVPKRPLKIDPTRWRRVWLSASTPHTTSSGMCGGAIIAEQLRSRKYEGVRKLLEVLGGWSKIPCKRGEKILEVEGMGLGSRGRFLARWSLFTFYWKYVLGIVPIHNYREIASGDLFRWVFVNCRTGLLFSYQRIVW